jgi:hypothetical protein
MERGCSKSKDTCSAAKGGLQTYKIYSIVIPVTIIIFIMEAAYVIYKIPGNMGSSMSIKGVVTQLPSAMK